MSEKVVDCHSHISQVEIQDIEKPGDYDKSLKYGMGHRDNLYLMDKLGIDVQVLHCPPILSKYHKRVIKENPKRFVAIGKIDERLLPGEKGLESLKDQVEYFGFNGIYYDPWHPEQRQAMGHDPKEWGNPDPFFHFDHERYDPQWNLIEKLDVPVAITVYPENLGRICLMVLNIIDKFPDLVVVLMHGLAPPAVPPNFMPANILDRDGNLRLPDGATEIAGRNVYHEILPGLDGLRKRPSRYGDKDDAIKMFFDIFGPEKLMWGSEFTYVEFPTFKQYKFQLNYLKEKCDYMLENDLRMIMGGTASKVYNL